MAESHGDQFLAFTATRAAIRSSQSFSHNFESLRLTGREAN